MLRSKTGSGTGISTHCRLSLGPSTSTLIEFASTWTCRTLPGPWGVSTTLLTRGICLRASVIEVVLISQAAQQPAADPRHLGRVQRQILGFGHLDRNRRELAQPCGAAQFAAATPEAAQEFRLIAHPHLAHLYPGAQSLRKIVNQVTEVHSLLRREVDHGAAAVEAEFHIDDLDVHRQSGRALTADPQRFWLTMNHLIVLHHVPCGGPPDDRLERAADFRVGHSAGGEHDLPQRPSTRGLHDHVVARREIVIVRPDRSNKLSSQV